MPSKTQTFNDGIVKIYKIDNIAEPGNMPKDGLIFKETLRYKERTVGVNRYWAALQDNIRINHVLRVPERRNVSTQDIAIPNDGKQYKIVQIQYPEDMSVMDLSLERLEQEYEIG